MSMEMSIKGKVFSTLLVFCIGMSLSCPTLADEYPSQKKTAQIERIDALAQSPRHEVRSLSKAEGEVTPVTLSMASPPKKSGGFVMWHISFENNQ